MSDAPKILILIPYPNDIGFAIGRLIFAFYTAAVRVTGDPNRVHVCFRSLHEASSSGLPAEFHNVVGLSVHDGSQADIAALADYVRTEKIRTVFALDLPVEAKCLPALRHAGVRCVISYWGAPISSPNSGLKLLAKKAEVRWLRISRPDLFIFESQAMRKCAISGRGIPEQDTLVIRTGVDIDTFCPRLGDEAVVYRTFNISMDRRIVVFMGHLHERKGVRVLLEAAEELVGNRSRNDIHFLFLGGRETEFEQFNDRLHDAFRRGFITFGGYHSNIPELLAGCYVGCIPSTGWDSFPMSSLEMQACGVPVVVSRLQGTPETIDDGVTGLSVLTGNPIDLANALADLCDRPRHRMRMSSQARERIVRELTTEHQIANLESMLRKSIPAC